MGFIRLFGCNLQDIYMVYIHVSILFFIITFDSILYLYMPKYTNIRVSPIVVVVVDISHRNSTPPDPATIGNTTTPYWFICLLVFLKF